MNGLIVAGTGSEVGKSVIVAGICRWLTRRGVRVAPFKAQNMALNSVVTAEGAEIGRAQAAQAQAARVEPEAAMNPILIKPSGERRSQVMLLGRPFADVDAKGYHALKEQLRGPALEALASLRDRFDVVICEGAGGAAEINLRHADLANLGLARAADLPVIVVGDIDRGGVFAALYGTLGLLEPADQAHVGGFLINRFRGDPDILKPGLVSLTRLTGRPVLGVLPWQRGLWLDVEDSLALEAPRDGGEPPLGPDGLEVAVVRLRWMSNFTDVDALAAEPGVTVRFTSSPVDVERADLVVVPGTKATVDDLAWLRARGIDVALRERARNGDPVLGICGGYQMLGERITDNVESGAGEVIGLGLLPVETRFERAKVLRWSTGVSPHFWATPARGFEIRHGRVSRLGGQELIATLDGADGCIQGSVAGTSWHGVMEGDEFRRAFLFWVAEERGRRFVPGSRSFAAVREARLDALGDLIERHVDAEALLGLISKGAPAGLPVCPPGGVP
ncbi:MAG: adenosylcobyric acid synthase [Miltoncostaeaceae bacterium]|jgi:adenosylcobyric acid synthase|nr:adenosylcobyric acid synthase [Miltoncostaeaceae bacterium]